MRILIILIISIFSCYNSSARTLPEIQKEKKLKVGLNPIYPPMEFNAPDGKLIGLDVDLAKLIAKELKVEVEFVPTPWNDIINGLINEKYDVIISAMNITKEREEILDFVPYLKMGQVYITKNGIKKVTSERDLKGRIVAVQSETTSSAAILKLKQNKFPIKEIKQYKNVDEIFSALKKGQAEVVLIDEAVARYFAGLDAKSFNVTGVASRPEPIGIAIRKTDEELKAIITKAIKKIHSSKEFKKMHRSWLQTEPK